ncbi:HAMP domain-containing protein [Vibrio sp. CAIM 722]|uniref:histidine kinase n=1 Tax=Vibrio eleionomae TaxID=2653505 RepID=A0A7X4LPP7_9VIBR|nr:HAMP domain-containing sensor histidine kinase [Vibrio eleionomae]MZI95908.1 HAMP domain-containing protein [Vibrio eleionomae]
MAKRRRLTLTMRMLLLVFIPLWALSAASIGIGTYYMAEQQTRKLKDDIKLIARAIRVPIGEAIEKGDLETVQRTLDAVFSIGQVYGASVYNKNGERIAAAGIARHDNDDNPLAEKMLKVGEDGDAYQHQAGRRVYSHFVPITGPNGQLPTMVEVTRKASDFSTSVDRIAYWAWGSWGLVGLMTLAIVLFGYRQAVGREMTRLINVMGEVGRGKLTQRAADNGSTEMAKIAKAFNQMLDDIETAQQEIKAHQAHEIALNQQLERQERMAALGRLVSGIAHELGAPLNVIDGRARRLARLDSDPKGQHELDAIRGQVGRLTRIVRQLLDFSRGGLQREWLRLAPLIESAIESVNYEQQSAQPNFNVSVPENIKVYIDQARFELVLVNLLRNACQAAQAQVGVEYHHADGKWQLSIWDDGEGIKGDINPEQLLEPFFTTKPKGKGTGLGLAIVHNVVHDHGGEMTFSHAEQGGLQVTLNFPEELT